MATTAVVGSGVASRKARKGSTKKVRVKAFGDYLKGCRERSRKRPPSVAAVATVLQDQGIPINHATIRGYEYGWADRPDPVVLVGLARLYKIDVQSLVAVLAENRRDRNLSEIDVERILRSVTKTSHAEAEAATRLAELREKLYDVGKDLLDLAGEQAPATSQGKSRSSENDRKSRG